MEIEGKRKCGVLVVATHRFDKRLGRYRLGELRRRGIRGVARPRHIVFAYQREVELGGGELGLWGGIGSDHGAG